MTVCMGYPAMTLKWESRKTPLKGGWKSMWGERHPKSEITLIPLMPVSMTVYWKCAFLFPALGVSFRKENAQEKLERLKILIG